MNITLSGANIESPSTIASFPIEDEQPSREKSFTQVLTIDIGGSNIKVLATGETEPRKRRSGKKLTPVKMVEIVRQLAEGWSYEAVSIGRFLLRLWTSRANH
jgi:polyphosphate glucokinase